MEYFQIQGNVVSINIIAFILILIMPVVIGIILYRYIPKILEFFERKFLALGSNIVKKVKNGITWLTICAAYRKIGQSTFECPKKSLESILQNMTSNTGKQFIFQHDLERKIIYCLGSKQPEIILISLKILRIIIKMKGPKLQIKHPEISTIIDLLSNQYIEVQNSAMETLVVLGENGMCKEFMHALRYVKSPEVEFKLANLCDRFFKIYSPEIFIDDETIKPIFRLLEYDNGTIRVNLLGGLWNCANKKLLKMSHIVNYDKKNMFRTILSGNIVDQRIWILSIFYILARNQEQTEIIDSGFLPLFIQNLFDSNDTIRQEADNVINQLLACETTKQITDKFLIEANAKGRLATQVTI